MECLTCGSNKVKDSQIFYFVIPHMKVVPASYVLCEKHKNVRYVYEDIYDEDGNRKKIV